MPCPTPCSWGAKRRLAEETHAALTDHPRPCPLPSLQLHQEMQATMYQLNAIRSELQGGINLFQPGWVGRWACCVWVAVWPHCK